MRFPFIMNQSASGFSSTSLRSFFSPIRKYFDASSKVSEYFSQIGTSVLFMLCTPFTVCLFYKQADGFGKLRWYLNHSHSCGQNRTMRTYHYPAIQVVAERLFQRSLSDHCVGRSLPVGKVMAYSSRGSLYYKRICLLYSVVKEQWRKHRLSCLNRIAEQERGGNIKSCSAEICYSFSFSSISEISKLKIILISASLIRPFNSMSTTI